MLVAEAVGGYLETGQPREKSAVSFIGVADFVVITF
jgi:hypothetical protein